MAIMLYNDFFIDDECIITIDESNQSKYGMVYCNDTIFESVDHLLYALVVEQGFQIEEIPEYCYGVKSHTVRINPMRFFHEVEEQYDCHFTDKAQNEFIKFAEEWNEKCQQYFFERDDYTKILIPKEYALKFYKGGD